MSKSIELSSFVVPYSQKVLGGVEGLTSSEIAKSTGLSVSEINQKIKQLPVAFVVFYNRGLKILAIDPTRFSSYMLKIGWSLICTMTHGKLILMQLLLVDFNAQHLTYRQNQNQKCGIKHES